MVGFFSGDTIMPRNWGSSLMARLWVTTVFRQADRIRQHSPDDAVLLVASSPPGYKTWRYLPTSSSSTAAPDRPPWPFDRRCCADPGAKKFGDDYQRRSGHRPVPRANPLARGVAEVTERDCADPLVSSSCRMNPGHRQGDETGLPWCPSPRSNLTPAGLRMLERRDVQE